MSLKRVVWIFFVAFAFFFLITSPVEAAHIVKETGQTLASAVESLSRFVKAL
jgi:hypothetical protein